MEQSDKYILDKWYKGIDPTKITYKLSKKINAYISKEGIVKLYITNKIIEPYIKDKHLYIKFIELGPNGYYRKEYKVSDLVKGVYPVKRKPRKKKDNK